MTSFDARPAGNGLTRRTMIKTSAVLIGSCALGFTGVTSLGCSADNNGGGASSGESDQVTLHVDGQRFFINGDAAGTAFSGAALSLISGALLLPVKGESAGQFYRKRFLKVLVPMVIYYILYVCAKEGFVWLLPDHWGAMLKRILLGAPEEAPHFWLIYVIIWLYVLTPFFRYVVQHIPDSVLSGLVAVILIFQILGT